LKALDDKRTSIDRNNPLLSNNITTHSSNHVAPVLYDNPTFNKQSGLMPYDDDDEDKNDSTMRKTYF
jgi:hypothetical protein